MKTVEEFIKEIEGSDALQNEIKALKNENEFAAFLKNNDCGASVKEYMDYVSALSDGEISDDDAKAVAGGWRYSKNEHSLRPRTIEPHLR